MAVQRVRAASPGVLEASEPFRTRRRTPGFPGGQVCAIINLRAKASSISLCASNDGVQNAADAY